MSDTDNGVPRNQSGNTDLYTRLSNLLSIDKTRDWGTVSRRAATRALAGGGATLAALAAGMTGFRFAYADKIYPNIMIGDVNVGGMTIKEAEAAVQARVDELNRTSLSYTFENHTWEPTLEEIGCTVDIQSSVQNAAALGRDAKAADRLLFTNKIMQETQRVPLEWRMKPWKLEAWLDAVDADIDNPAIDATFTVKDNKLLITQDSTGIAANRDATTEQVLNVLKTFEPVKQELSTEIDYPKITKTDLEANEGEVLQVLSSSVTVRFEDRRWEIEPSEVSGFMIFTSEVENGAAVTHVDFDRQALTRYLRDKFEGEINRKPVNSRVQFFQGVLSATTQSQDGKALLSNQFADLVAESFLTDHSRVDVPVVTTRPKVREDNLDEMGIKDRLCRVDSNYVSDVGTDRQVNIEVGVRLLNNTIIAPGDDFSFNGTVGAIEQNPDFISGTGISARVISEEFGGGICQCTTTVFRAAIMAGLPIPKWDPHTYRLEMYERDGWGPGFDASIFQPDFLPPEKWSDLTFTNNTGNYILLQSWSTNGIHVVEIYGTDPGWKIEISPTTTWEVPPSEKNSWDIKWDAPAGTNYLTAYPVIGLGATFNRTVWDADGNQMYSRDFTSNYQSRGYQCRCSPDMKGIPCW